MVVARASMPSDPPTTGCQSLPEALRQDGLLHLCTCISLLRGNEL